MLEVEKGSISNLYFFPLLDRCDSYLDDIEILSRARRTTSTTRAPSTLPIDQLTLQQGAYAVPTTSLAALAGWLIQASNNLLLVDHGVRVLLYLVWMCEFGRVLRLILVALISPCNIIFGFRFVMSGFASPRLAYAL